MGRYPLKSHLTVKVSFIVTQEWENVIPYVMKY